MRSSRPYTGRGAVYTLDGKPWAGCEYDALKEALTRRGLNYSGISGPPILSHLAEHLIMDVVIVHEIFYDSTSEGHVLVVKNPAVMLVPASGATA